MQETTVEIRGQSLRLLQAGDGPPVVFLHGASGANWYPLLEELSRHRRVIAPEHPGFGRSALPDWMMSVGDLAFFYLDLFAALDLRDIHLVGHSLGGWTAAEIAIRNTVRLASVSLLAPAGVAAEDAPFGDIFLWSLEQHAHRSYHDPALIAARLKTVAQADLDLVLQNRAAAARLGWSPRLHNPQLPHWLHRIDVPTLLVWGEEDQICPFACRATYLEEIPEVKLLALPNCGHALHTERWDEVAAGIQGFFAEARR